MKRMPDSIIEIECKVVKGKAYFHRFFVHLVLVLKVFEWVVDHGLVLMQLH